MKSQSQTRCALVNTAAFTIVAALMAYPLKLTAATTLANGYVEQPYKVTLQSSFGTAPYMYKVSSGTLPHGVGLGPLGVLSGTPTASGAFSFAVQVTDSSVPPVQQTTDYTLSVLVAVTTYHNDNYRSGANTYETVLTPSNVNVETFGKIGSFPVAGWVVAQPLYVPAVMVNGIPHNLVFIATEHDQVYAFETKSGQQLWHRSFLFTSGDIVVTTPTGADVSCSSFPEVGVMGTPVIDTSTGTMYLVAKTKRTNTATNQTTFVETLHAMDITTGKDKATWPIAPTAPGTGNGSVNGVLTFDPLLEAQRPGLMLYKSGVFIAFGSYCDKGNYHGWITAFDKTTLQPAGVMVDTPNGHQGGYWAGGSGLNVDSSGAIYGGTGNGLFDANTGGSDYGDTILKLNWSAPAGTFTVADYFTPWNQLFLDNTDHDLGSGGVLLLPDQPGTTYPHLLVQAGKEGTIDLVSRDNMGHFHANNDSQIVQTLPSATGPIWGSPAFWNNNIYFGPKIDNLKVFSFDPNAQLLSVGYTSKSSEVFGRPGVIPSVSANGNTNGIVWVNETDMYPKGAAILRAYDATNLANELYNSSQNSTRDSAGLAVQLTTTTVVGGLVFVPAQNEVDMYGLLPEGGPRHN